jgi:hypothetical protein
LTDEQFISRSMGQLLGHIFGNILSHIVPQGLDADHRSDRITASGAVTVVMTSFSLW